MSRFGGRSQFALPVTLAVTLAAALLPASWRLSWQTDLAQIVQFPLRPFYDAGNILASRLRPAPSIADSLEGAERDLEVIIRERDLAERRYISEHQRLLELERQLAQLQRLPIDAMRSARRPVIARITRRSPNAPLGVVELKLPRGMAEPVWPNTVAVYAGVHLLGRTVGDASRTSCSLLPIASSANGFIRARVFAQDQPLEGGRLIQVEPTGTGDYVAKVDRDVVFVGDRVRVDDPSITAAAQGMVLGDVESVEVDDAEPLRNRITIRPVFQVAQVASVTLLIEQENSDGGGDSENAEPRDGSPDGDIPGVGNPSSSGGADTSGGEVMP